MKTASMAVMSATTLPGSRLSENDSKNTRTGMNSTLYRIRTFCSGSQKRV